MHYCSVRLVHTFLCSFSSCFFAPLSRRCRCGRHAHVAGCGTGSRHGLCPGRTHTSVGASVAASRPPDGRAIVRGPDGVARPRAADEPLVGVGQHPGTALPSRKEGGRGMRGEARAASRGYTGAIAVHAARVRKVRGTSRASREYTGAIAVCTPRAGVWACQEIGGRGAGRRTNISLMAVTLEVSQLTMAWLKAFAPCRESQAGHTVRGAGCGGRGGRRQAIAMC